ncbi:helix-turn-helix domain-containing protein [Actinomycetospora lutea]|uniref:helix-turn-helix domain-containing protein n=1 Tax=Actinomycetospora lutea TaxID=663604 RepID=UPI0023654BCD|nr:helix-turn-helix domain-containing protein [Actinomycetospora lutea]MDD7938671.1 helix-turn-helix domain-containing protein [Actinomycetospora lutea]
MSTADRRRREAGPGPGPASTDVDVDHVADLLDDISAELETIDEPDHRAVTGEGPEASENRMVAATQASLARAAARALRGEADEARRANRATMGGVRQTRDRSRRAVRPAAADVPLADLERLARQALAVTGPVVWAELAVPPADGAVLTATAGHLPAGTVEALQAGPRAEVLRTGAGLTVEDADTVERWPGLRSPGASFLVLPLGIWGALTLAADEPLTFDDTVRAVAREVAAHGVVLLTHDGARDAGRARSLVITASTLLARRLGLDPTGGVDALLERATSAGSTILNSARHVVDELGPPGDDGVPRSPEPATLRRAIAFLEEHAAQEIDVADVAAAAGLGVRGLQTTFRRWRDTTPLGHLREIRLARAHEELRDADPRETTVADVAHRWRFSNPGRFSVTYRERYRCSPSETLRA